MKHTYMWKAKAFVYYQDGSFHKMVTYHNIDSRTARKIESFEGMLRKQFRFLHHVNYYSGDTGLFVKQTRPNEVK